jgi:voltage-gated sodium channel
VTVPERLSRVVSAHWFTTTVLVVIVVNAVVLGLETYAWIDERYGDELDLVNDLCFVVFVVELTLRIGAYGRRPWLFFRDGWNVFDFVVIAVAFVPGIRQSSTLLRLARLARVVRIVRLFPDLRVLLAGVWRSIPPLFAIGLATGMLLFVYGMIGWTLFADELPADWGNIGRAMLTLFVMLTLENFPTYMDAGMEVHPWSWVYFVSFILIAAFVVINVLIGIVLNSMEEAREAERRRAVRERLGAAGPGLVDPDASAPVVERIGILRAALDELEAELSGGRSGGRRASSSR